MRKSCYQEGAGGDSGGSSCSFKNKNGSTPLKQSTENEQMTKLERHARAAPLKIVMQHTKYDVLTKSLISMNKSFSLPSSMVSISRFHGPSPSSGSWCSAASNEQQNRRPLLPRIQQCQIGWGVRPICGVSCVQRQNSVKIVRKNRRRTKYSETGSIFASNLSWLHSLRRMWHNKKRWPLAEIQSALAWALSLSARSSRLFFTPAFAWGEFMTFTTLQRQLCFKGCHYSLLLRYGLKAAVLRYGTNHTFSFLIKLVLLEALVLVPFTTWHHIDVVMKQ